jgi:glycosyltransferase involved in cell wall biosynthesis
MSAAADSPQAKGSETTGSRHLLIVSSDTYPPTRVDVRVLFGQELSKRGIHSDLILQSEAACGQPYSTSWEGGTVWVGSTDQGNSLWNRLRKHIAGIRHDLRIFQLLRRGRYDVVVVKDKFISGVFAWIAAKWYRRKFLYWLSYPFPEEYLTRARDGTARYPLLYLIRGNAFKFLLYRVLLPAADHCFVQSEQMLRDIASEGVATTKMTPIPMGVDVERFAMVGTNVGDRRLVPSGQPCILYLGTLVKVRRLDFLVRVLARVRQTIPEATLYFVGRGDDPSDEALLVREAQRLNIADSVVLVGQLPQDEALRYVQEADVCVSPFFPTPILNSTSPTKLVEYLAMGKAVVANDHPEQRLVIEQSGAGHCVPWDEEAFSDAITNLLRNPAIAEVMGRRGRAYALEHRSYSRIADLVEQALRRLLNDSTQSPRI